MIEKDDILIEKIKRGDSKALRILYDTYFLRVVNYSYKLLHNKDDACEVAQDVFIKIWDMRAGLDEHKSSSGLIFRIAKFKSIDYLRKAESRIVLRRMDNSNELFIDSNSFEHDLFAEELQDEYHKVVDRLPSKRRRIFQLSRDENLTYKQIAQKLDISPKTVEAQIRLALQQLRTYMTQLKE